MSSTLLTPDLRRILDDLGRRIGILERRIGNRVATPAAPVPAPVTLPTRLMAEGAVYMGNDVVATTIELLPLDGSDPNVRWGDSLNLVVTTGPYSLTAGRIMQPALWYPSYSSGSIGFDVNFVVWNPAATQFLRVVYQPAAITGGGAGSWVPSAGTAPITLAHVGSDLSLDGNNRIVTAGGGVCLASAWFGFAVTPTP